MRPAARVVWRVARFKHGPLNPPDRLPVYSLLAHHNAPYPRRCWSRFDVEGRTAYFGETPQTAYAEALGAYKRLPAPSADANFMGADEIDDVPEEDWAQWRADRRLWPVELPQGEFIDILAGRSIAVLEQKMGTRLTRYGVPESGLTTAHLLGEDRELTTAIADVLYGLELDGRAHPLGVTWESKRGWGRNYALWLRPNATIYPTEYPARLISAHDEDLQTVAKAYRLQIA
ncbi:RES domain-containing protein [Cellulomonas terrae]|nr:RES domain-containing protein [Cellulomonas terrae]